MSSSDDELHPGADQHRLPVPVDPAPVVGVLRADPLQVGGALGHLGGELGGRDGVPAASGSGAGSARGGPGRRAVRAVRGPHLTGLRVDPAPVPHHDPLAVAVLGALVAVVIVVTCVSFSSSTISASTTSSAWSVLEPPWAWPASRGAHRRRRGCW